ncbi:YjbF family lipoprotein [Cobetia sp. MC34]|uniref:YjbF family lipoprotein n=1 Tax=Cobetia sp. MC34 TaxID=2785080 RepID=UPI001BC9CB7A|nr:YjbF family lipoprotein [Cobetia sp. MC34]MBS4154348.1 YjbF family lipoprotein [Cobetia sp. MC34]
MKTARATQRFTFSSPARGTAATSVVSRVLRSRSLAAFGTLACLVSLSGCAQIVSSSLGDVMGKDEFDATRASELPYASLKLKHANSTALVVLATLEGNGRIARFESRDRGILELRDGVLSATSGFARDVADRREQSTTGRALARPAWLMASGTTYLVSVSALSPYPRRLERQDAASTGSQRQDDVTVMQVHEATARLECEAAAPYSLPLAELPLQHCREILSWDDGSTTRNDLWRDENRVWAADMTAWPGGPRFGWEVAKAW